jgi:hypothetical protein
MTAPNGHAQKDHAPASGPVPAVTDTRSSSGPTGTGQRIRGGLGSAVLIRPKSNGE